MISASLSSHSRRGLLPYVKGITVHVLCGCTYVQSNQLTRFGTSESVRSPNTWLWLAPPSPVEDSSVASVRLTRAALAVVTAVMVLSGCCGLVVGITSYEVSACRRTTRFLLASNFLEGREDHGRTLRGERLRQA